MSWTQHIKHPSKIVGIGDIVEAVVLKIDKDNQKISLGFKQLEPDPWERVPAEFPIGTIVKGKIRNIAAFGAFVELKEGVDGLIHISDMSWTKKINHPGELLKKGDVVEVKVLDIDPDKRRISLGIKQLSADPWEDLAAEFPVGAAIETCEVARILDRGIVVNCSADVEGFIPLNQIGQEANHPSRVYKVGDVTPARVIEFDLDGRKIILSIADYFKGLDDPAQWEAYKEKFPVKPNTEAKPGKGKAKKDDADAETTEPKAEDADAPEVEESVVSEENSAAEEVAAAE
jgi:small subunit ribosomal protein S1